jgi:hypothetical protein
LEPARSAEKLLLGFGDLVAANRALWLIRHLLESQSAPPIKKCNTGLLVFWVPKVRLLKND